VKRVVSVRGICFSLSWTFTNNLLMINPLPNNIKILRVVADDLRNYYGQRRNCSCWAFSPFTTNDFYPNKILASYINTSLIVVCKVFQVRTVQNMLFGKGLRYLPQGSITIWTIINVTIFTMVYTNKFIWKSLKTSIF